MRILVIAAEAAPYVKVGGLADVVGTLPRHMARMGAHVDLLIPGYRKILLQGYPFEPAGEVEFPYHGRTARVSLLRLHVEDGLTVTLVDEPAAFGREGVYDDPLTKEGYRDNPERFAFFSRAAAELAVRENPDVVHVHDSHGALVPGLLKAVLSHRLLRAPVSVLTVHNLAHQMHCRPEVLFDIGFPKELFFPMGPLEFHGNGNFLKAGLWFADAITTVSERYAHEVQTDEFGCGLEGLLRTRSGELLGILNGIDTSIWDPSSDPMLPANYDIDDLRGKAVCREELLRTANLHAPDQVPVIGMVGRLADQKGLDVFAAAAGRLAELPVRFTILGSGQEKYHQLMNDLQRWRPDKFSVYLGFHDELAHRIEAGSDFFLMPSRFEPCGLNQMYSMRYGTLPIVRRTGGLADTVLDVDESPDAGTGFAFGAPDADALLGKVHSALRLYQNEPMRRAVQRRAMSLDFSGEKQARKYLDLFEHLLRRRR